MSVLRQVDLSTVARAVARGAAAGSAVAACWSLCSSRPVPLALVAAGAVFAASALRVPRSTARFLAAAGAVALALSAWVFPATVWLLGPSWGILAAGAGAALASAAVAAPARSGGGSLPRAGRILAVAAGCTFALFPPALGAVVAFAAALLSTSEPPPAPRSNGPLWVLPALIPALAPLAGLVWAAPRIAATEVVGPWVVAAFALGSGWGRGLGATAGGVLLVAGGTAALVLSPDVGVAGAGLFALALGAGLTCGSAAGSGRLAAASVLGAATLWSALSSRAPAPFLDEGARVRRATPNLTARLANVRKRALPVARGLGARGAWVLSEDGERLLLELDGFPHEPEGRAARAERFAGTLAGCLADSAERAVVVGDVFGAAAEGAIAQGFRTVESAVPDPGLLAALTQRRPARRDALLSPASHLLPLPDLAVTRIARRPSAFVEVVRTPWSRPELLSAGQLRALRGSLAPGGVVVLALGADRTPAPELEGWIRAFATVFPSSALWLPPEGAEVTLLTGRESAAPWSRVEACVAADRKGLASAAIREPLDLAALAFADREHLLEFLPAPRRSLLLPAWLDQDPGLSVADLPELTIDVASVFAGAPPELAGRAAQRVQLLDVLKSAEGGDLKAAVSRARALDQLPVGDQALASILAPHLDRARAARARALREGLASPAWEEAESALATAAAIAPETADVRCLEGDLALDRGQLTRAEDAYRACVRLDPGSLAGQTGLARARGARGDQAGAEVALRTAAAEHPDAWTAAHNYGVWLLDAGRFDEAEPLLKQAAALQARATTSPSAAPFLALARLNLATGRPQLALAHAQRALGIETSATGLALRGAAQFDLRDPDRAESDFRAALAKNPDEVLALGGLGQIQATRGEYELAARSFTAVLKRDPKNAAARANLDRLEVYLRDPQAAPISEDR